MRDSILVVGIVLLVLAGAIFFINTQKIKVVDDEGKVRNFQVEIPLPIVYVFGVTGIIVTILGAVIPSPYRGRKKGKGLDDAMREASK